MFLLTERIANNISMASSVYARCYTKDQNSTINIVNIFLDNAKNCATAKLNEIGYNNDQETRSARSRMISIDEILREMQNGHIDNNRFNNLAIKMNRFKTIEYDNLVQQMHKRLSDVADFNLKHWNDMSQPEQKYLVNAVNDMTTCRSEGKIDPELLAYYKETEPKFQELIVSY